MGKSARLVMLMVVAPALAGLAQAPPAPVQPAPGQAASNQQVWTVRGCIRGSRLERSVDSVSDASTDLYPNAAFALKGNKELLAQLRKDHQGHLEEVTGVVVFPRKRNDDALIGQKQVGKKTKITVGARETSNDGPTAPVDPELLEMTVKSFSHIADRCVSKR